MKLTINIHWNLNRNVFTMLFAADVENILSRAIRKIVVPASYKKKCSNTSLEQELFTLVSMVSMDEFAGAFCFALDPAASVAGLCVRVNVSSYAVSLTILNMMV